MTKDTEAGFESVFTVLKNLGETNTHAAKTYDLLKDLNAETENEVSDLLVSELLKIRFASNTNTVFLFYFPMVSHILHYKPQYGTKLLGLLIGPAFANGVMETEEMIPLIQRTMEFQLSENKNYLTKESQDWISNELPKMEMEVEREVQKCWKELEE